MAELPTESPPESPGASPSRALLLLAAAFFLLAAVIVAYSLGQRSVVETSPPPDGPDQASVLRTAPAFSLPALRGSDRINLAAFTGQVVVLNFFASWCRPCELEAADLERAWRLNQGKGVVFLGVAVQDEADDARGFVSKHGTSYLTAIDLTGAVMRAYRVAAIPTTFFIGADGRIAGQHAGIFVGDEGIARLQERIDAAKEAQQ
jgi:cytochrome c biogenesis protein CcmG/thiol:disulfide interchange protein DsbE